MRIIDQLFRASLTKRSLLQRVQRRMVVVVNVFRLFEIIIVCFVLYICDQEHDVDAIHMAYLNC